MKILLLLLSVLFIHPGCASRTASQNQEEVYAVGVGFNSICCGTPSDEFLKTFVKAFNKNNSVSITADKLAGCGKEGENVLLFHTQKLGAATGKKFIAELEKLIPLQNLENKKADSSSGGLEILRDVKASAYSHCRISLQSWTY